jgi:alkylresorcinol/alkylpyrone synthase
MTAHPRLGSLASAVPPHVLHQDEVVAGATRLFAGAFGDWSRFTPVYANAEIKTRYSCVPIDWYQEPHGFGERNSLFLRNAVALLEQAITGALTEAGLSPADIDGIVTVSSSGIATPSLDALLMERLPFRRDLQRLPIFGLGCAGGVLGLSRAAQMARAEPAKRYLFCVVELCGLTFRQGDRSKSNVVATALFGDGAAAAVVGCGEDGPALVAAAEHTWPASLDIMGWDVRDDGLAVVFSRDIPTWVRRYMGEPAATFLASQKLTFDDIDRFIAHPGGAKVLDALEECFGLSHGGLEDSRETLRDYGNMSAATVMFVLRRALNKGARGRMLLSTLGPGFTAGFLLLDAA